MKRATHISRRRLLRFATGGLIWVILGWLPSRRASASPGQELFALLSHPERAAVVGHAFLAAFPQERSLPGLERNLCHNLGIEARHPACGLRAKLSRAVDRDFATDQVVVVAGWRLSLTEARLAAFAALKNDSRG